MNSKPVPYLWTDAWVLQSVLYASKNGGADLRNIIAFGDTINQAIFRPEELESGFCRLSLGGWIEERAGKFEPTAKARAEYAKLPKGGWSLVQEMEEIASLLGAALTGQAAGPDPGNRFTYPGFTRARFDAAVKKYRAGEP